MQKKNRSISKGVIEAKDKQEISKNSNNNQHFSPNMAKRTGVNLNTFLSSKPVGTSKEQAEGDTGQSDNLRGTNNINNLNPYQVNSSVNNSNMGTNYQKYSKNVTTNPAKSQMISTQYSGINSSNNIHNNSNVNNTGNTFATPFPQKNMKLESIKNINTVIRKLKSNTTSSSISNKVSTNISKNEITKIGSVISNSGGGTNNLQKKVVPVIPSFHSNNMSSLKKDINKSSSGISNNNHYIQQSQQLNPQNLYDMSPSNSLANMKINNDYSQQSQQIEKLVNNSSYININNTSNNVYFNNNNTNQNQSQINNSQVNNQNNYGNSSTTNINNTNNLNHINLINNMNLTNSNTNIYASGQKGSNNFNMSNTGNKTNLFNKDVVKDEGTNNKNVFDKNNQDNKKTQETKDNSSNSSTIKNSKNFLHSNTNSLNTMQIQLSQQSNIENPEDLHFFYVKMFQANKEYAYKFEKEEKPE